MLQQAIYIYILYILTVNITPPTSNFSDPRLGYRDTFGPIEWQEDPLISHSLGPSYKFLSKSLMLYLESVLSDCT